MGGLDTKWGNVSAIDVFHLIGELLNVLSQSRQHALFVTENIYQLLNFLFLILFRKAFSAFGLTDIYPPFGFLESRISLSAIHIASSTQAPLRTDDSDFSHTS